jgi:hypothetical protein
VNAIDRQIVHLAVTIAAEPYERRLMKIWNAFGIHPARFYQRINQLIEDPAARAAMPAELARLERIRERRRRALV